MSRIGRKPIKIENKVKVALEGNIVHVVGERGRLDLPLPDGIELKTSRDAIEVVPEGYVSKSIHGLFRSLLQNAVTGVSRPWTKILELVGVGYQARVEDANLVLNLGFTHPVKIPAPPGITFQTVEDKIIVSGVDKYLVGEVAAKIRDLKKPEPYKGKGIRYQEEYIRKKLGKAAKVVGVATSK